MKSLTMPRRTKMAEVMASKYSVRRAAICSGAMRSDSVVKPRRSREEDGDLAALALEVAGIALDARRDLGADVAAESIAQPPLREDVGAHAEQRGDRDGQQEVHPVAAAAEGEVAGGHAQEERARQAHRGAPERAHGDHDEAGQKHRHQLHGESREPAGRAHEAARHQHVDDVRLDLHAGHEAVRRAVYVAAVGEGAADQHDAAAKRIVAGDVDARRRRWPPRRPTEW